MTTNLENSLRDAATDLTLDRPVGDVLARGTRLRSRRRRNVLAAGAAAAVVAAGVLTTTHPLDGTDPSGGEEGDVMPVAWSSTTSNLTPAQIEDVREACARSAARVAAGGDDEPGWQLPSTVQPLAAQRRDDTVLTYFHGGGAYETCTLAFTRSGRLQVTGQTAGSEVSTPQRSALRFVTAGAADPGRQGGKLSEVYAVLRTSPATAHVALTIAGQSYPGTVADKYGLAFLWLPDQAFDQDQLDTATIRAFDSSNHPIGRADQRLW